MGNTKKSSGWFGRAADLPLESLRECKWAKRMEILRVTNLLSNPHVAETFILERIDGISSDLPEERDLPSQFDGCS